MAHIVLSVGATFSRIHASLELARRLQSRGHRITYVTYAHLKEDICEYGFDFVGIHWGKSVTTDSEHQFFRSMGLLKKLARFPYLLKLRHEIIQRFVTNSDFENALKKLKPDLLIIDLEMQPYVIASSHLGMPTILFFDMFSIWKIPGVPPLDSPLVPEKRWYYGFVIKWLWFRWDMQRLRNATRQKISSFGTNWIPVLRVLARYKPFPFREEADCGHWLTPFVFRTMPIITANALEMEFSSQHPPNVHYVGPLISPGRHEKRTDGRFDSVFTQLINRKDREESPRPLIYCATSTFVQVDSDFLRKIISVFEIRKDWDLILGLGGRIEVQNLGPTPPNVFAFDWAPQLRVLERADCAINHGGTTSINECVYYGVPMVVYSTKTMDHNGNAARVAFHRLGIVADKDKDTIEDIMRNIEAALFNTEIKQNLSKMGGIFLNYSQSQRPVSVVEKFLI